MRRFLCSYLVTLSWNGGEQIVNLEEIWESGAVLECEGKVPAGTLAEIRSDGAYFAGHVSGAEKHEFGWRIELKFSPMTPWSEERFRPAHLLDLSAMG